jgi:PAS domain S-box-containing protein
MTENLGELYWLLEPKTFETIYLSPALENVCGCGSVRVDPQSYRTFIHPDDAERVVRSLSELKLTTHTEQEFRLAVPGGAVKWVLANASMVRNVEGHVAVLLNLTVDTSVRKKTEEVLRENNGLYRDLAEHSRDLIYAHNLDGTFVSFNDRASNSLEYTRDDIPNTSMKLFIPTEAYGEFDGYLSRIRTCGVASGLMRVVTKTGQCRMWEYYSTLQTQGVTEPIVRTMAHDVTDQKHTEETLRSSEEKFSRLFMSSPLASAITTLDGDEFVDVNEAFERETGFRRDEVIGKNGSEVKVWIDSGQRSCVLAQIKAGGRIRSLELHFRNKKGTVETKLYSAELVEVGRRQCLLVVCEDITQRKIVEETLRQSEANYRSLFLSSPCGMYRVALDGAFMFVNDALVELLGYDSSEELLSKNLEEDIYANPEERYRILNNAQQLNPLKSVEVHWRRKNGTLVLVRAHARGWVSNDLGQVVGLETMVEDITKQRILEEQLRQMQKMESLALLAGGIAHDFNNILTAVLGYSQLALKTLKRIRTEGQVSILNVHRGPDLETIDKTRAQLQHIVEAAFHGQSLTGQLLAFSRHESLPAYPLNLDAEIKNMSEMVRRLIGEHIKVQIHLECESQKVLGETGAFGQVIVNLCVNARDAMPKGGRLTVRTLSVDVDLACTEHVGVPCGRYVVLEIADTGCGMSKTVQERIFEPFFTTKPTGRGTGLGLYTVYAIVHRCGGHIRMASEPDRGSTFWLYLPVVDALPTQCQVALDGRIEHLGKGTVMVVEDDNRVREIVAIQLEGLGFKVLCEASAVEAVRDYDQLNEGIELLVTDVVMPELNGLDLAKILKERQPNLRVLYMTGWAPADLLLAEALGQDAELLRKPFDERAFNSTIRHLLSHPEPIKADAKLPVLAAGA